MRLSLVAAAILAGSLSPAFASTITYTITGTVIDGDDRSAGGVFGGGSLKDKTFTATEILATDHAQSSWADSGGSGANGGTSVTGLSFIDVMLAIGSSQTSFSDYTSNVSAVGGAQFNIFVQSSRDLNKNDIGFYIPSGAVKADYTEPSGISGLADPYAGYYTLTDQTGAQVVWANFQVTDLSVAGSTGGPSAISPVPLPASAPLFGTALVALALTGYGMRRLRSARPN